MKRIVFLIPSLQSGGMERVMSELLWYFSTKKQIEIHLILYGIKREVFYPVPKNIKVYIPSFEFDNSKRFFNTIKTLWFLRKKIRSLQPHSILSFGEFWNSFVLLATYGLKYPIYVSDRCQPDKCLGKFQDALRKWLYLRAAGIIAQTNTAKAIYERQLKHPNIRVVGNPINRIQVCQNIAREKIVLSVGRLISSKHHDQLIRLFVKLNRPEWKLIIVGGDALKQNNFTKLQQLVKDLGAEGRVELTGTRRDVADFYRKASIFAFASSSEGFPNVIGEALSAGLPVVAFDCVAGPSDMIKSGHNGYLIELFNYQDFAKKLALLIDDNAHREQLAIQAPHSIWQFERDVVAEQFFQFITGKR